MIKLFFIRENNKKEFSKYLEQLTEYGIKEEMILNPKDIGAYYFSKKYDGSVEIITQNLKEEAVPFNTFEKTVNNMKDETDIINEAFYSE